METHAIPQIPTTPQAAPGMSGLALSVFEGGHLIAEAHLDASGKNVLTFGASPDNDIVIASSAGIVSRNHGTLQLTPSGWAIFDNDSTNGLFINGEKQPSSYIMPGHVVSIGRQGASEYDAVVMLVHEDDAKWVQYDISGRDRVSIGRATDNDICLESPAVSAHHAALTKSPNGQWAITDNGSFNGTYVDGNYVSGTLALTDDNVIRVASTVFMLSGGRLFCTTESKGVEVVADDLVRIRKTKGREIVTNDHISLYIGKGELVAIVGGSGSGKTTLLNELNGSEPATSGSVRIDGVDLYSNYGHLKNAIGYVPQQDIVYDDLRLIDMLVYAAELRMPPDTSKEDRVRRAEEVLEMLELSHVKDNMIGRLSGGQKKRASIAVELLADPRLLFLDEPTSGLDPGIEQNLMKKLASMAHEGRTIILVTHTTLNLDLCDRVVFLAPGGKLAYAGDPAGAPEFFGVDDFVDAYNIIAENPQGWSDHFLTQSAPRRQALFNKAAKQGDLSAHSKKNAPFFKQLLTLSRRYAHLIINDRTRLALLLLQAPILAALICLVAGEDCFSVYEDTKSCLFALSCAAFWVGMLNSIQEICKERVILRREYASGLSLTAYVLSKVIVLGFLCVIQSLLLTLVFCLFEGVPEESLINANLELFVTIFLTTFSAMCLGLAISALFKNPDRAIAMAPILIMPQILFSGLVFKLEGFAENISVLVNCRWGMEAFGTTADLNGLDLSIYEEDMIDPSMFEHEWEAAFDYTVSHLLYTWGILGIFCIVCTVACGVILRLSLRK